jgi:hypothetical protein
MTSEAAKSSTYRYAVFRYEREPHVSIPVGVALWSEGGESVFLRFPEADERVSGISNSRQRQVVITAASQVEAWVAEGELPYLAPEAPPTSRRWWSHLATIMEFGVGVTEPAAIDCVEPEEEVEALFEAVVGPEMEEQARAVRVDGAISRALGELTDRFQASQSICGFGGKPVTVRRLYRGPEKHVVAEGVNLASPSRAERDADALASKLLRLAEGASERCEFLIGYISSPEGLNGEAVYVDWLEHKLQVRAYDLLRQRSEFHAAAEAAAAPLQPSLPQVEANA